MLKKLAALDRAHEDRGRTLTALIQEARSAGLIALHSFLTLGVSQFPLTEVNKRAETSAMREIRRKPIPKPGISRREVEVGGTANMLRKGAFIG